MGPAAPDPQEIADALAGRIGIRPDVFIVLGSGLGAVEERVDDPVTVSFGDLDGMPGSSVQGHAGRFVAGRLGGVAVLVASGRFHAYEGHGMDMVALPVRVAAILGANILVATNAAGGIREDLGPGDLVLIQDHLNLMFRNPLVGAVREGEARFPDMSAPYDPGLAKLAHDAAGGLGIPLAGGTYAAVLGPSYETAAEVRMLSRMGADVVGMSTVPEVIVARARGMKCLAFSMVTNRATGLSDAPLSHDEVLEVGRGAGGRLADLITEVVGALGSSASAPSQDRGAK
jgi:purine-nucleoside phosphorylase